MKFHLFLAAVIAVMAASSDAWASGADKKILHINTGVREPFTTRDKDGFVDQVIGEMFRRIGVSADVIVYQASSKSLANANAGIDDGAALRIKGLESKFPNLMRVPEKLMDNDFVAYSLGQSFATNSWADLARHKVAYINGWVIFQSNLKGHKAAKTTKNAAQLMDALAANYVDVILYERWQGLWRADEMGMQVTAHEPPLAKREMFMYLHKKHEALVDRAADALAEMKKDGTYMKIFNATLAPYRK